MNRLPRILIVDDVAANRLALRTILKDIGAELREADNGFDAVSMSLAEEFALILLDIQMPDMDGFEVCEQLRENPQTSEVPIIFLTAAYREDEHKIHGYLSGATDYISKPVNDRILRSKVEVYLKLHHQQQALMAVNESLRIEVETRRQVEELLDRQASTDTLTEILNRRAFFDAGNQELNRMKRYGGSACLVMLDIDHFKRINDTYGHQAGDEALRFVTRTLGGRLRANDIFGRVGGEEFGILMMQTSLVEAAQKMSELLDLMRNTDFIWNECRETLTFSAGISPMSAEDMNLDDAFSRADKLLYRAKSDGRACVRT